MIESVWVSVLLMVVLITSMLVDWLVVGFNWGKVRYFSKPLVMILLIIWTLSRMGWAFESGAILLLLAQFLGLAGDVLLMFSGRWFLAGLGAFLAGHFSYIFLIWMLISQAVHVFSGMLKFSFQILLGLVFSTGVMVYFYRKFRPAFISNARKDVLWRAVQVYAWIISTFALLSFILALLFQGNELIWRIILPTGGVLFLASDLLLAYNRFIQPLKYGQLLVRVMYHLAQFSLALSLSELLS